MKKFWKRATAAAIALTVALSLSGCGELSKMLRSGFDASGYIQGILDCTYKATYEKYLEMTEATEEQAAEVYENGIEAEAYTFMQMCGSNSDLVPAETIDEIKDFYRRVYQHSRYEVKEAVKSDTGFFVEVVIEPIDILQQALDDLNTFTETFNERTHNGDFSDYTEAAFEDEYIRGMLEICTGYESQIGYLEPKSIVVTVAPDETGLYTLSDEDFSRLDMEIIAYN